MKKRKKITNKKPLHGTTNSSSTKITVTNSLQKGALMLGAALLGGGVGAVIGKHSLLAGIPVVILGVYKDNKYLTASGLGLCISNGFQKTNQSQAVSGVEDDMHGFDLDQIKERVGTYFKNFSEKLYLPKSDQQTNGFDEMNGTDEPTYFLNPYNNAKPSLEGDLDLSQLDKVQANIAQMSGMDDREF